MKSTKSLFFLLSVSLLLHSCNQESSKVENNQLNKAAEQTEVKNAWKASSDLVKKITQSDSLVIRNKNWGMDINRVNDQLELAEIQPAVGKSYSLYFDDTDLNFVDITYIPNEKGQLNAINMDIFVEEAQQVTSLQNGFKSYFDIKFGASAKKGKKIIWEKNKNTQVEMEDASSSKDLGIKIILKAKP